MSTPPLTQTPSDCPEILAPAGNRASFLAALAAGADAVYCGLKDFSARMAAPNFSVQEMAALAELAHASDVRVYIALNTLIKPDELDAAARQVDDLNRHVHPDALIIQDPAVISIARRVGFSGELHLSTLANVSFPAALPMISSECRGVTRVVVPRELHIDEVRDMARNTPKNLGLEIFIHGALCFGVSGRCYWSSFLGGKSGLRGRCVQPCRRRYEAEEGRKPYFSCQDLSLDVLTKVIRKIPQITAWKIEGRKKGPHYVHYTVTAYKMLRDEGQDPQVKKQALGLLDRALGRPGTHYYFLPQRPQNPVNLQAETGSGLLVGRLKGGKQPYIIPREELFPDDRLRIGYEDEAWHRVCRVSKYVPKRGRYFLKLPGRRPPSADIPVFLMDRREPALRKMIAELESKLRDPETFRISASKISVRPGLRQTEKQKAETLCVSRHLQKAGRGEATGLWMSSETVGKIPKSRFSGVWWWLPPVIWPSGELQWRESVATVIRKGGRRFVLNAPWQRSLFPKNRNLRLWAGPFCNISNPLAAEMMADFGFSGAVLSPEMGEADILRMPNQSPIPLGIVVKGLWPLTISREMAGGRLTEGGIYISPKGERAWVRRYESEEWVFPDWEIDISDRIRHLSRSGYSLFIRFSEPLLPGVQLKKRPGLWNWSHGLS